MAPTIEPVGRGEKGAQTAPYSSSPFPTVKTPRAKSAWEMSGCGVATPAGLTVSDVVVPGAQCNMDGRNRLAFKGPGGLELWHIGTSRPGMALVSAKRSSCP
mmetsp:Transcript_56745/g.101198  ORF Transcript_56745/g.101198 Transcript_56745/m.101198 type:complete len:102 (-) Transcript_56745:388-693(-)